MQKYNFSSRQWDAACDSQAFEETYLYMHHLNFGMCKIKPVNSFAPLGRLETLAAKLEALETAALGGLTEADQEELDSVGAKRRKPDS